MHNVVTIPRNIQIPGIRDIRKRIKNGVWFHNSFVRLIPAIPVVRLSKVTLGRTNTV